MAGNVAGNGAKDVLGEEGSDTFFSAVVVTLALATVIGLLMLVCGFGTSGDRNTDDNNVNDDGDYQNYIGRARLSLLWSYAITIMWLGRGRRAMQIFLYSLTQSHSVMIIYCWQLF